MKTSEIVAQMKRDLLEHGWVKNSTFTPDGARCLDGAVLGALGGSYQRNLVPDGARDYENVTDLLRGVLFLECNYPTRSYVDFNDAPSTKFADVMSFLDKCELRAKEIEADS